MRGSPSHGAVERPRVRSSEQGFAFVEVIVSAVLLLILAMATLSVIDGSHKASAQTRSAGVASSLAHADLDRLRQTAFSSTVGLSQTTTKTVDGQAYTVASQAVWTSDNGGNLTCTRSDGSGGAQYLRISSTVSWTNMGSRSPVTAESLFVPRTKDLNAAAGSLVFKVQNSQGLPLPGVTVTAQGQSLVTDSAGCVIFAQLTAGPTPVQYSKTGGYVDMSNNPVGTYNGTITAGVASVATVSYEVGAKVGPVAIANQAGGATNGWTSYSIKSGVTYLKTFPSSPASWSATGMPTSFTGVTGLYPLSAGYSVYASVDAGAGNTCTGNDPAGWDPSFTKPGATVVPAPGGSAAATAYLKTITVSVANAGSAKPVSLWVKPATTVTQMNMCGTTAIGAVNATSSATGTATLTAELPYGVYKLCVDNGSKYVLPASFYNNTPDNTTGTYAPTTTAPMATIPGSASSAKCSGAGAPSW
jgi:Tfp pilus assembly protein PilE